MEPLERLSGAGRAVEPNLVCRPIIHHPTALRWLGGHIALLTGAERGWLPQRPQERNVRQRQVPDGRGASGKQTKIGEEPKGAGGWEGQLQSRLGCEQSETPEGDQQNSANLEKRSRCWQGCPRGVACTEEGFGSSSFRGGTALGKKRVLALALATRTIERNSHGSYGRRDGDA